VLLTVAHSIGERASNFLRNLFLDMNIKLAPAKGAVPPKAVAVKGKAAGD
jgi:hypothetical protein